MLDLGRAACGIESARGGMGSVDDFLGGGIINTTGSGTAGGEGNCCSSISKSVFSSRLTGFPSGDRAR
jgi:hypothetical protein